LNDWLDPVRAALDASPDIVQFFFRDDDAGWDDEALWRLLDRGAAHGVHIDVAVIPSELDTHLAAGLRDRAAGGFVHLHQHGFRHTNHEITGRKCEFGASRSHDQQLADIADGQSVMNEHLHPYVEPVFTPPWNRCTAETAAVLLDLGFQILSRDRTAVPFEAGGLGEIPVAIDWFAKRKGVPLTPEQITGQIAGQITCRIGPVGIMLHHAVTDLAQLELIDQLLTLVTSHPSASSTSIYSSSF
jgi:peptidoglycan/xylan/chitin deacetylase (PgdA/CDA1 family)